MRILGEGGVIYLTQSLEVGVYGCGPFMAEMESSLQAVGGLRVRRLGNALADAVLEMKMLSPDAVIFEMSEDAQSLITAILQEYPGTMLIGIGPGRGSITVFSASERTVSSGEELARVIRARAKK